MRADAEANYERLLDAASEIFAEHGADAPMGLVADRAGVGKGTLYRHFEDRDALIVGLGARLQTRYAAIAGAAASAPTGWDAIEIYLDGITGMYFDFPWMVAVRARARRLTPTDPRFDAAVRSVIERAHAEGSLRADAEPADVVFAPSLLSGLADLPEPTRSVVTSRQRDIILDGLRADGMPRPRLGGQPLEAEPVREYVRDGLAAGE